MKRCCFALITLVLTLLFFSARAEYEQTVSVHSSLPEIILHVKSAGSRDESYERQNLLSVSIQSADGSLSQEISYWSSEMPEHDGAASLVRMADVTFDGYQDLLLLTAQGARNVFYAVSVYHPEENRFLPVLQTWPWQSETRSFNWEEQTQLELCNEQLFAEKRLVSSTVADGYRCQTEIVYQWESGYTLAPVSVIDIYDAGDGMIGELVESYGTGVKRWWDAQYPEEWYYGQEGVYAERRAAYHAMTIGDGVTNPQFMRVANVDWVNLRKQDSKASPSLAKLDEGTPVQVLGKSAQDEGWIRVLVWPEDGDVGLTGYIWHSYLKQNWFRTSR